MNKNKKTFIIIIILIIIVGLITVLVLNSRKDDRLEKNQLAQEDSQNNVDGSAIEQEKFKVPKFYINTNEEFSCEKLVDAIDIDTEHELFITKDNELYRYSLDKVFSNEKNYKKIETESNIKFTKFLQGFVLDINNNLYRIKEDNVEKIPIKGKNTTNLQIDYNMPFSLINMSLLKKDLNNTSYVNFDFRKSLYFYKIDNAIYNYKFDEINDETHINEKYILDNNNLIELDKDEKIELFLDGTVKTNKGYYIFENKMLNKEMVDKYADTKPEYKIGFYKIQDEDINNQLDKIVLLKQDANGLIRYIDLVTVDGKIYHLHDF